MLLSIPTLDSSLELVKRLTHSMVNEWVEFDFLNRVCGQLRRLGSPWDRHVSR